MSIRLPFIKNKQKTSNDKQMEMETENIPNHVAIIMDGNGRWAKKRALPRIAGHKEGVNSVVKVVRAAYKSNIKVLTLYAFSTENWKRPKPEIEYLMKLPKEFLHIHLPELMEKNVRIQTIGDFESLPTHTKKAVQYAIDKTKGNDGLLLNFALNYGSRDEIMQAIKQIMTDIDGSKLSIDSLDEQIFSKYLYTQGLSDPDLLIRTSGEQRLSNFLLWQLAYTEFWFTDVLWPDFSEEVFQEAIQEYQQRQRRYGGI
ncbi:MAG: isoprenyl transferase [Bacillota bacterium]|uniref:Isoprenyl transferase n=1 Tax=Virgibacillus salarius TaxID=447199 RepID=A0A941IA00_9BACI|nr:MULTISPECIES: isoprenyl transferase [Bacillaceae]NAZ07556.1 isoprenyl transferase [Agaribacter marinus]MBR7794836.1 isoprenyl transferase [Virgibacillus salarius]MCC2249249.1 isoprenyl transferase [Virgibacillus sp. AGTR]MDY7043925.1 isoprenyl transferase [Virgibacillus sp. M23]QRZ17286.1 isoprenyl transferase [Virgibacillus sp. AGTR]